MRRRAVVVVVTLFVAACSDPGPMFAETSAPSTTTVAPATTASSEAVVTTAGNSSVATAPNLAVYQVLVRIDGALPVGTLDATICNLGNAPAPAFEVVIGANGREVRVAAEAGLPARDCTDAFDSAVTFDDFGISAGDVVQVTVDIVGVGDAEQSNVRSEFTMTVDRTTPGPDDPADLAIYQACLVEFAHRDCIYPLGVTPVAEPHEILKMRDGWAAVVPIEYEPLAAQTVATLDICFAALEGYLGIPFPEEFQPLPWRFGLGDSFFGASFTGITLNSDAEYLRRAVDGDLPQFLWSHTLDGKCQEAHETTHVMVAETPIPGWLNEGLAVFDSHSDRTNWYYPTQSYRCEADGYVDINEFMGTEVLLPYADLEGGFAIEGRERGDYYVTGACFWEWFEGTYGHDAVQRVIAALAERRAIDGRWEDEAFCLDFVPLVQSIVGEDISSVTEERFGFGRDYDCWSP